MRNSVLGLLTRGLCITAAVEASNKQSPRLLLGDSVLFPHPMLRCNLWIHPSFGSLMRLRLYFLLSLFYFLFSHDCFGLVVCSPGPWSTTHSVRPLAT